jgi:hypothetical protein
VDRLSPAEKVLERRNKHASSEKEKVLSVMRDKQK